INEESQTILLPALPPANDGLIVLWHVLNVGVRKLTAGMRWGIHESETRSKRTFKKRIKTRTLPHGVLHDENRATCGVCPHIAFWEKLCGRVGAELFSA